jgi:hypothetical protein
MLINSWIRFMITDNPTAVYILADATTLTAGGCMSVVGRIIDGR